jgi:phage-related holin
MACSLLTVLPNSTESAVSLQGFNKYMFALSFTVYLLLLLLVLLEYGGCRLNECHAKVKDEGIKYMRLKRKLVWACSAGWIAAPYVLQTLRF